MNLNAIRATSRLFLRATPTIDLDGWRVWEFPEAHPHNLPGFDTADVGARLLGHEWVVRESPSGVRHSTLKIRENGNTHTRALRRIEEDHLMKFAIRP